MKHPLPQKQNHKGDDGTKGFDLARTTSTERAGQTNRPETYRVPSKGGDPYFGLTRSWYYAAEKDGLIHLIRLRKRGRLRRVTLVPYDAVAAIINAAKLG